MATIAAGSPFLETLADAYFDGSLVPGLDPLGNPLLMHETTIFLPTRRAAKTLSALFAERANPKATLLPTIIPLGDADRAEDNLLFSGYSPHKEMSDFLAEADPLFRRLMLAQLIMRWTMHIRAALVDGKGSLPFSPQQLSALRSENHQFIPATTPHDALALADALGQLIDTLSIHGKSWEDLHKERRNLLEEVMPSLEYHEAREKAGAVSRTAGRRSPISSTAKPVVACAEARST